MIHRDDAIEGGFDASRVTRLTRARLVGTDTNNFFDASGFTFLDGLRLDPRFWIAQEVFGLDVPVDFLIGYPVFGALCFLVALLKISPAFAAMTSK